MIVVKAIVINTPHSLCRQKRKSEVNTENNYSIFVFRIESFRLITSNDRQVVYDISLHNLCVS